MFGHVKPVYDSIYIATDILTILTINPESMKASLDLFMLEIHLSAFPAPADHSQGHGSRWFPGKGGSSLLTD